MRNLSIAVAALFLLASPLHAQVQPFEFSVDGGFQVDLLENSDNVTSFTLPFQALRMSAGVGQRASIEGALRFAHVSQGDNSATRVFIAPGLTYHFQDYNRGAARPYVSAFGALSHIDADTGVGSGGDTQFGFGGDVGVKLPIAEAGFFRLEGTIAHFVESDNRPSDTTIALSLGLGAAIN